VKELKEKEDAFQRQQTTYFLPAYELDLNSASDSVERVVIWEKKEAKHPTVLKDI
jgi:hypothetical protein